MKLVQRYTAVVLLMLVQACAITGGTFGTSPEAQIVTGANTVTAAATVATTLLKNNKISVAQARGYQGFLTTASGHLDAANVTLLACRKKTGARATPDPCTAGIEADIRLAVSIAGEVSKTLKAKE